VFAVTESLPEELILGTKTKQNKKKKKQQNEIKKKIFF
jgi:hypothetical protein